MQGCSHILNFAPASVVVMDEKPKGFANWHDAIEAVVDAKAANLGPDELDEFVWEAFETMAFVFMPKISQ
jgi:hypothetical protein